MGDATEDRPKCLTQLLGRSLLDWQLEALSRSGIEEVAAVTGYRHGDIDGRVEKTFHNTRWARTNMVVSLTTAAEWLCSEPVIVAYSDIVYRPHHVTALMGVDHPVAMTYDLDWLALWSLRFDDPLEDAETFRTDGHGGVTEIGRTAAHVSEIEGQFMGLLKFTPGGWQSVTDHLSQISNAECDRLDMTSLLNGLLEKQIPIRGVPVSGGWCEVDNQIDATAYERRLSGEQAWSHDWRTT